MVLGMNCEGFGDCVGGAFEGGGVLQEVEWMRGIAWWVMEMIMVVV